jgi:PAT family beta-lactamase induction signal transducer AmpG
MTLLHLASARALRALGVYGQPAMLVIAVLGFTSGLPLKLALGTVTLWMAEAGVNVQTIAVLSLVSLPYATNFLWAPLVDGVRLPWLYGRLGPRRSWMVVTQLLLAGAISGLAWMSPGEDPWRLGGLALVVTLLSATYDISLDAWRVERFAVEDQGAAAAAQVFGYRMGMLWGAAGMLRIVTAMEDPGPLLRGLQGLLRALPGLEAPDAWQSTWPMMGASMLVGVVTALGAGGGAGAGPLRERARGLAAWSQPVRALMQRPRWGVLLLVVFAYKLSDVLAGTLVSPYLVQVGFHRMQLANARDVVGLVAALAGAALGGWMVRVWGVHRMLVWGCVAMMVSNLAFSALWWTGPSTFWLGVVIAIENSASAAATAGFVAWLSGLCDPRWAATQYALLTSIAALARTLLGASTGWMATALGWPLFFAMTALASLPALLLLRLVRPPEPSDTNSTANLLP